MARDFKVVKKMPKGEIIFDQGEYTYNPYGYTPYKYLKSKKLSNLLKKIV